MTTPPPLQVGERGEPVCPHCQRSDARVLVKYTGSWAEKMSWSGFMGGYWEHQSEFEDAATAEYSCWECEHPVSIPEAFE